MDEKLLKKIVILDIEALFPPDSSNECISTIGQKLLHKVLIKKWRKLPYEILKEFYRDCVKYNEKKLKK